MPLPNWKILLVSLVSLFLYIALYYFTPRSDFQQLMLIFGGLFGAYLFIKNNVLSDMDFKFAIMAALGFRVLLLFGMPNLSDDFYRFVWDGRLLVQGINPFEHLPSFYVGENHLGSEIAGINQVLFSKLNSPEYFTIYPPINQYVFAFSCWLFPNSILGAVAVMKSFILLFEIGSIYWMIKLLGHFGLSRNNTLIYALNPLVILELVGNVHFEAAIIFFTVLAIWLLVKGFQYKSALAMAMGVCSKLLPLIFLPLLLRRLGFKRALVYYLIVSAVSALLFATIIDLDTIKNMSNSLGLYFGKFEFNAGVYYVLRWIGFNWQGYNLIQYFAPTMGIMAAILIMIMVLRERTLGYQHFFVTALFILLIYFSLSTIVHPWYITSLVALTVFTSYRFPIWWSLLIMVSYFAYSNPSYLESLGLIGMEYGLLYLMVIYELWNNRKALSPSTAIDG